MLPLYSEVPRFVEGSPTLKMRAVYQVAQGVVKSFFALGEYDPHHEVLLPESDAIRSQRIVAWIT